MTKKTIKPQKINYSFFKCPTCNTTGNYTQDNEETICNKCGTIIDTPHRYVAGIKINTISDFQIQYEKQKQNKRWKNICKKKMKQIYSETAQP